ncbi:saccharopine dehydrogenase-like oxidoreductase [Ptychodera flava]|uniref:saccharopine dehydrogenase-like oxidoreductase n=1 Tax=Ptychodera flava TaxID=63121 RepID=UPI00396A1B37
MAASTEKKFDLVVFGASGFTGQFVVEEVARVTEDPNFKWAVAGRSESKMTAVLKQAELRTGKSLDGIEVLIADVTDEDSMAALCKQTKLLLNCVGPYRFWGEQTVKACVENGAHHIDISGEPQFLEKMQLKYHDKAKENNVYVVGSCGFDSIPADMGVEFMRQKFPGEVNTVENYLTFHTGSKGMVIHYATWQSAIHGFADQDKLKEIRKVLNTQPLPKLKPRLQRRGMAFFSPDVNKWCVPFLGADASVVRRSQKFHYEKETQRPIQFGAYVTVAGLLSLISLFVFGSIFGMLAKFKFGRTLLEKYPKLFTLGLVSHEGPSREQMEDVSFSMTFYGEGFSKKGENTEKHDMKMVTKVTGPEPGYVTTPIAMVQAAKILLSEQSLLPNSGGVYSPGAAYAKTTLIEKLVEHGIKFTVVSEATQK